MNSQSIALSILLVGIVTSALCFKSSSGVCAGTINSTTNSKTKAKAIALPAKANLVGVSANFESVTGGLTASVDRPVISPYAKDITHQFVGSRIITKFTPQNDRGQNIDLDLLAASLGYDHFNWASYVIRDPYGIVDLQGQKLKTPYNDPPQGGYHYQAADTLPFYWDIVQCDRCKSRHHFQHIRNRSKFQLIFEDYPADYRLQRGEAVEFVTSLVGVKHYDLQQHQAEWEILHTFRWKLTNPHPNFSQVSLVENNLAIAQLSPWLLKRMKSDGAIINYDHGRRFREFNKESI